MFQILGKIVISPNTRIRPPEIVCQTSVGTPRRAVVAFSKREKTSTDIPRDTVMITGLQGLFSPSEPPSITGRIARAHGAITVNSPAMNETISRSIV